MTKKVVSITLLIALPFMSFSFLTQVCVKDSGMDASILKLDVCEKQGAASAVGVETLLYFEQHGNNIISVSGYISKKSKSILYTSHHIFTEDRPPRA